jgi:two-component system, NarL family, invasion response regulator UvrY
MTTDGARPIHVLLVDDHPVVRQGLALLLAREDIVVCAQAEDCAHALLSAEQTAPTVALVDLSLGPESGLDLIGDLEARGLPVLVYSMHEDGEHVQHALAAGARGYVTKREMHRVLTDAIREVAAGREYLGPRAAAALAAYVTRTGRRAVAREPSGREREVYRLLGEGATSSEIAGALKVSIRTVESYCARLMEKLGVDGMKPLRRDAIRHWRDGSE